MTYREFPKETTFNKKTGEIQYSYFRDVKELDAAFTQEHGEDWIQQPWAQEWLTRAELYVILRIRKNITPSVLTLVKELYNSGYKTLSDIRERLREDYGLVVPATQLVHMAQSVKGSRRLKKPTKME